MIKLSTTYNIIAQINDPEYSKVVDDLEWWNYKNIEQKVWNVSVSDLIERTGANIKILIYPKIRSYNFN